MSSRYGGATVLHKGRVVLYHPKFVEGFCAALAEAKADLHDLHFKHVCEMADLRRELDACRAELDGLRTAVLARQHAEGELAILHRERDIARAQAAERDPNAALN
jgi:hypothetical protein